MNRARVLLPAVMALLYGASPIDLIPDLIPLLGWSDDVTVFVVAFLLILHGLRSRRQRIPAATVIRQPQRPGLVEFDTLESKPVTRFELP